MRQIHIERTQKERGEISFTITYELRTKNNSNTSVARGKENLLHPNISPGDTNVKSFEHYILPSNSPSTRHPRYKLSPNRRIHSRVKIPTHIISIAYKWGNPVRQPPYCIKTPLQMIHLRISRHISVSLPRSCLALHQIAPRPAFSEIACL